MTEKIVVTEDISTAGAVVWWTSSGPCDRATLDAALAEANIAEKQRLLPSLPSIEVCLHRAVAEQRSNRRLIRPLKHRKAWGIVVETATANNLEYEVDLKVSIDAIGRLQFEPTGTPVEDEIQKSFTRHLTELTPKDISRWLVRQADSLGAARLREQGALYFIPREAVEHWKRLTAALRKVSGHRVYSVPAMRTTDVVDAVLDAITDEVARFTASVDEEITSGLGKRGLENRTYHCKDVLAKVSKYEKLLGKKMSNLREQVSELEMTISAAILAASEEEEAA